jgi:uncharacterized SAM-binding protein YcdF (DUF218 family)
VIILATAALIVGLAGLGLSVRAIVEPEIDVPSRADAVITLSGDRGERLPRALGLVRAGVAPTLVIDGLPDLEEAKQLCRSSPDFEVICLHPTPDNTRSEAEAVGRLARDRGWTRVVVVTDKVHVARARLLFDRCVEGAVAVVAAPTPRSLQPTWKAIAHEWLGITDALTLSRGC